MLEMIATDFCGKGCFRVHRAQLDLELLLDLHSHPGDGNACCLETSPSPIDPTNKGHGMQGRAAEPKTAGNDHHTHNHTR